ncbi:MAG: hypothetical protein AB1757_06485 [Acidobacteriota bacterium]
MAQPASLPNISKSLPGALNRYVSGRANLLLNLKGGKRFIAAHLEFSKLFTQAKVWQVEDFRNLLFTKSETPNLNQTIDDLGEQHMKRMFKSSSLILILAMLVTSTLAQSRQNAPVAKAQSGAMEKSGNTPGRIAKFTDNKNVGDSNITESDGKIGIGTATPTSPLTVQGMIETTLGGYKFPDGTMQTTAGLASVFRDNTLKGNGTQASPSGVAVPLNLTGDVTFGSVLVVSNTHEVSTGVTASGGAGGAGVRGQGGNDDFLGGPGVVGQGGATTGGFTPGGTGVAGVGGHAENGQGGAGLIGDGGESTGGDGGTGVSGQGARGINGNGGKGLRALGGSSGGAGTRGGTGLEVVKGFGVNGGADGLAGNFLGNVQVIGNVHITGTLSKGGGSFKIDHPLDPENKYLSHSFVESPDMMNIYNGNITTDVNGRAVVELPEWFEALNKDFRYQLTVVGQFAQAIVAEKVKGNHFVIQTNAPNIEVSWQVTGIRHDNWANSHRIPVEEMKSDNERGLYLHPEVFTQPEEKSVMMVRYPERLLEAKKRREAAAQSPRQ